MQRRSTWSSTFTMEDVSNRLKNFTSHIDDDPKGVTPGAYGPQDDHPKVVEAEAAGDGLCRVNWRCWSKQHGRLLEFHLEVCFVLTQFSSVCASALTLCQFALAMVGSSLDLNLVTEVSTWYYDALTLRDFAASPRTSLSHALSSCPAWESTVGPWVCFDAAGIFISGQVLTRPLILIGNSFGKGKMRNYP